MTDPIIVCVNCEVPLYYCDAAARGSFAGTVAMAEDFIPVDPEIPAPHNGQEMLCPMCGKPFATEAVVGGGGGMVVKLEDGAWWPHPPVG